MTISVIYQGTTSYCNQIPKIKRDIIDDIIFSTWDDEPKENIDILISKGYKIITSKKPENFGFHNINLQTTSTLEGIKKSKNDYVLKIRSDMIIDPIEKFLNILFKKNKMSFLCFHDYNSGYVCDYINYGNKIDMMLWWDYLQKGASNTPPEIQLLKNFLNKKNISYEYYNYPKIKNIFDFFLLDIDKQNVNINWLKNKINLNSYLNDKLFFY